MIKTTIDDQDWIIFLNNFKNTYALRIYMIYSEKTNSFEYWLYIYTIQTWEVKEEIFYTNSLMMMLLRSLSLLTLYCITSNPHVQRQFFLGFGSKV